MKRCMLFLVVMATTIAFVPTAIAQFFPPPCNPLPQDRTITFCYPVDDETVTQVSNGANASGWIKDSLPHTANIYIDGKLAQSNIPDEFPPKSGPAVGIFGDYADAIHTFTIVVTDSQGSFRKSASLRNSLQLPCALPSTDPGFVVCTPSDGEVASRPMRIAAVARANFMAGSFPGSSKDDTIQVWIDGTRYGVSHDPLGTTNVKILNSFFYIPVGTHKITILAHMPDGTKIVKHRTVTIVNYTP